MKNAKIVALSVAISFLGILIFPNISSAVTYYAEELQAQINALMAQVQSLQAQLAQIQGQPAKWCHDFNVNLKIGDSGSEVESLTEVLFKEGLFPRAGAIAITQFDEEVASAVSGFQQKYKDEILTPLGLKYGTGFVGKATRAKLNSLYGCSTKNLPPVISSVIGPTALNVEQTGTWTVTANDPENGVLKYSVIWGDEVERVIGVGTYGNYLPTIMQSTTITHSYAKAGIYNPTFTVTDDKSLSAKTSISVNVGEITTTPSITVLSPNGGEVWEKDSTQLIKWSATPTISTVDIYLIVPYPSNCTPPCAAATPPFFIARKISNDGVFEWKVGTYEGGSLSSGQYKMYIVDPTNFVSDSSDAPFSIDSLAAPTTSMVPDATTLSQMANVLESAKTILLNMLKSLKSR